MYTCVPTCIYSSMQWTRLFHMGVLIHVNKLMLINYSLPSSFDLILQWKYWFFAFVTQVSQPNLYLSLTQPIELQATFIKNLTHWILAAYQVVQPQCDLVLHCIHVLIIINLIKKMWLYKHCGQLLSIEVWSHPLCTESPIFGWSCMVYIYTGWWALK